MLVNEIRGFIFENYYKRIGFSKENSYYSMKHQKNKIYNCLQLNQKKKIPDPPYAKQHYQSFKTEKDKISKTRKNNYSAIKNF